MRLVLPLFALVSLASLVQATVVWDPLSDQSPAQWGPQTIVDNVRAAGEPVIIVTPNDTILIAGHPSWTLYRGTDPYMALSLNGQDPIWRSTDHGATWSYVVRTADASLTGAHCVGVSDPDLSVSPNGRLSFAELPAPRAVAISESRDDGLTWSCMNAAAMQSGQTDRPFLARSDDVVYSIGRVDPHQGAVYRSLDGGATWEYRGASGCARADIAIGPTGKLYVNCGSDLAVSSDGGLTWDHRAVPGAVAGKWMRGTEPALGVDGTIYMAWRVANNVTGDRIFVGWSGDDGASWSSVEVTHRAPLPTGDAIWPVVTAGSAGRVAVTWLGTTGAMTGESQWRIYNAMVSVSPVVTVKPSVATPNPIHVGIITSEGFAMGVYMCNPLLNDPDECGIKLPVGAGPDRRMGELFKTAVDREGYLVIAYPDTEAVNNIADPLLPPGISHAGFVRQVGGFQVVTKTSDWHVYS